jgi:hypothetical protein
MRFEDEKYVQLKFLNNNHTGEFLFFCFLNYTVVYHPKAIACLLFSPFLFIKTNGYLYPGLGTEFRPEKIPRNRLGTVSVIVSYSNLFARLKHSLYLATITIHHFFNNRY